MSTGLGKILLAAIVTTVVSLLVTESYQSTPWLADKFMRWSVRLRYTDNPERTTVRGEELISLLADLPTLFKLPTAAGFLLRALAYRAAHRHKHARCEPRAIQYSLGARFRIALAKAVLVILCAGTLFAAELAVLESIGGGDGFLILVLGAWGLTAGIVVASEVVAQPSRFRPGFIGGIMCALVVLATFSVGKPWNVLHNAPAALLNGTTFWLVAALVGALTGKSRYVGFVLGALVNLIGFVLVVSAISLSQPLLWLVVEFSGLGIAGGAMAGFAAALERRAQGNAPRGIGARSGVGVQK